LPRFINDSTILNSTIDLELPMGVVDWTTIAHRWLSPRGPNSVLNWIDEVRQLVDVGQDNAGK
jgi:hypothetical protein